MDDDNDISSSLVIKKAGFEVTEGLKYRFDVAVKRRRIKSRDALAQALELWLANPPTGAVPSEVHSIGTVTEDISLLATGFASLTTQIQAMRAQNVEMLRILKATAKQRGEFSSDKQTATGKTAIERGAEAVFPGVAVPKRRTAKGRGNGKTLRKKTSTNDRPIPRVAGE